MIKPFIHSWACAGILAFMACFPTLTHAVTEPELLTHSNQLLSVITTDWNTSTGTLQRYQRSSTAHTWRAYGAPIPVVIGKNGMGWGITFHDPNSDGPVKIEGDGKSPAGLYPIGSTFGFATTPTSPKMPYLPITNNTFCVDDMHSPYYNQIIHTTHQGLSGESMVTIPLYAEGAVIQYNQDHPEIGRGSCIFMHIWRTPTAGTAGCIAMAKDNIQSVLAWLDPTQKPVIALFPQNEYQKLQKTWGLPNNQTNLDSHKHL